MEKQEEEGRMEKQEGGKFWREKQDGEAGGRSMRE